MNEGPDRMHPADALSGPHHPHRTEQAVNTNTTQTQGTMSGQEHYREAERLAGPRGEWYSAPAEDVPAILARAQVHATLALAAATALANATEQTLAGEHNVWRKVAGSNR